MLPCPAMAARSLDIFRAMASASVSKDDSSRSASTPGSWRRQSCCVETPDGLGQIAAIMAALHLSRSAGIIVCSSSRQEAARGSLVSSTIMADQSHHVRRPLLPPEPFSMLCLKTKPENDIAHIVGICSDGSCWQSGLSRSVENEKLKLMLQVAGLSLGRDRDAVVNFTIGIQCGACLKFSLQ